MIRRRSKIASICFSVLVLAAVLAAGQQSGGSDIVARLLPEGDPHRLVMPEPAEKSSTIKELQSAQKTATGSRSVQLAFLLAAYDSSYEKNRDSLIENLHGCTHPSMKSGCDGDIAAYLIVLYQRGHKDVLKPLMQVGKDSFSPLVAESLGEFFANLLTDDPREFFDMIRHFPPPAQNRLCDLAGTANGSGMKPETLQRARTELKARGDTLSLACLEAIEGANRP